MIVKYCLADLVDRPDALWIIWIVDEPARKHLIAVTGRIEEIDRLATGDAVARWADIERDVVAGDNVRCLADLVPGIKPERRVVELAGLSAADEGNVVGLVGARQERCGYAAVRGLRRPR